MFPSVDVAQLLRDQQDPAYQARLAIQRHRVLTNHVWQQQPNGEWHLAPVLNGSVPVTG